MRESPSGPSAALVSALLVLIGVYLYALRARDVAVALVVAALGLLIVALLRRGDGRGVDVRPFGHVAVLIHLGLLGLHVWERLPPGSTVHLVGVVVALGALVVACAETLRSGSDTRRSSILLALASAGFAAVWLWANSGATIDVLVFQQEGAARLLAGTDPYLPGYPNIYDVEDTARFYGAGLVRGDVLAFGFPYPPLSLLLSTLGHVVGDVRIAHIASVAGTTWLLMAIGRGGSTARVAAVLFATSFLTYEVVVFSWTEPFLVGALALWAWTRRTRPAASDTMLGLLIALKQYGVLLSGTVLLLGAIRGEGRTAARVARAAGVALLVSLPFAVWHPADVVDSVVGVHLQQPFRPDSLSLLAVADAHLGWPPPSHRTVVLLVATATTLALGAWIARRRGAWQDSYSIWAATAVVLVFFLTAKQAFANYYFLVASMVLVGVAAHQVRDVEGETVSPGRP